MSNRQTVIALALVIAFVGPVSADNPRGRTVVSIRGEKFFLNGREIYFRGTHNGGDFPLAGYPPTDVESWKKMFRTCQEWGLNHMRFHSWCPPEAAFEAADELGFYLQPECGMWNDINPGSPMEKMLYEETDRNNVHAEKNKHHCKRYRIGIEPYPTRKCRAW